MKIVFSCGTMQHAGAERVISILANKFVDLGHEVELLLYYDKPIWYDLDERITITVDEREIGNLNGKSNVLGHLRFRRKYIKKTKPDVVLSFLAPFNMVNIVAMRRSKTPLIVADRNDPKRVPTKKTVRMLRNFLYRFADVCVFQSEDNKNYFCNKIRQKSVVIYNPLDLKEYQGVGLKTQKKNKIVAVGRIIKQKNPKMLLDAFNKISEKFPDYTLTYIGDGDMADELKKLAEQYGLKDRVVFTGGIKNVFAEIADAELYVMTSEYEGMPNALLEAMCIGLPCISTSVSGAKDVIKDGENGFLVECGDVVGLAEKMEKVLSSTELANMLAENATKLSEKLKIDIIAEEWLDAINKAIDKK